MQRYSLLYTMQGQLMDYYFAPISKNIDLSLVNHDKMSVLGAWANWIDIFFAIV